MKKALITGITGQDGSYLAELLLEKGYEVHGIIRRASISNTARINHLLNTITLHDGDLSDSSSLIRIIQLVQPDEIYNLAAQSHVQVSFDVPEYSGDVDALGVLRILEACRILELTKKTRIYQASTSELFGKVEEIPQRETTPFHPYSPYAVAKQYGFWREWGRLKGKLNDENQLHIKGASAKCSFYLFRSTPKKEGKKCVFSSVARTLEGGLH